MPFNWLAAVQAIPWGQVIDNTPKLIEATRKLFSKSSKPVPPLEPAAQIPIPQTESGRLERLETLAEANRNELVDLQHDLQESVRLIQVLAEQNAQMVIAIEGLRRRTRLLSWLGVVLIISLVFMFWQEAHR
ncbi:hypothetical protein [Silvimonas soli]|uniref:hypothetical protein n=1 Tax=Silvimonas soli TaxID=2980100 RepID=UPI0024B33FA4|nr:hypothetical protein [Silvimonas soli]